MSFGDYWYRKQVKNPKLVADGDAKITLTLDQFRKELEKAFLAGTIEGRQKDYVPNVFDSIFGRP